MFSYEERLKTFIDSKWPRSDVECTPELMAISGFVCKSRDDDLIAMCVFCKKYLEGWNVNDTPIKEHYIHKKTCKIFHLGTKKSLLGLFFKHPYTSFLSSIGFVRYDIKKDVPFFFCYKCGSTDTKHDCELKNNKYRFTLQDDDIFFFNKLISGKYLDVITQYLSYEVTLPFYIKETVLSLSNYNPFDTLGKTLSNYVNNVVNRIEQEINSDISRLSRN